MTTKEEATVTLMNLTQSEQTSAIVSTGAIAYLVVMPSGCGNDGVVQMGAILPFRGPSVCSGTVGREHWGERGAWSEDSYSFTSLIVGNQFTNPIA